VSRDTLGSYHLRRYTLADGALASSCQNFEFLLTPNHFERDYRKSLLRTIVPAHCRQLELAAMRDPGTRTVACGRAWAHGPFHMYYRTNPQLDRKSTFLTSQKPHSTGTVLTFNFLPNLSPMNSPLAFSKTSTSRNEAIHHRSHFLSLTRRPEQSRTSMWQ